MSLWWLLEYLIPHRKIFFIISFDFCQTPGLGLAICFAFTLHQQEKNKQEEEGDQQQEESSTKSRASH